MKFEKTDAFRKHLDRQVTQTALQTAKHKSLWISFVHWSSFRTNSALWILMCLSLSAIGNWLALPSFLVLNSFSREGYTKQQGLVVPLMSSPTSSVPSPTGPLSLGAQGSNETSAQGCMGAQEIVSIATATTLKHFEISSYSSGFKVSNLVETLIRQMLFPRSDLWCSHQNQFCVEGNSAWEI